MNKFRLFVNFFLQNQRKFPITKTFVAVTSFITAYLVPSGNAQLLSLASGFKPNNSNDLNSRFENQFRRYATKEFNGVLYMTPDDFLFSLFDENPPIRHLESLTMHDVERYLCQKSSNPPSSMFWRSLGNQGLISFTEYLFLLCLLNKPKSGFEMSFKMLDIDCNGLLDAHEFKTLHEVATGTNKNIPKDSTNLNLYADDNFSSYSTLMRHFFGKKGQNKLSLDSFCDFIEKLQDEVLEMEFSKCSGNKDTITPLQFSRILLHHTKLQSCYYEEYLQRLQCLPNDLNINLKDYKQFFKFLNHLADFQIAMKMYIIANRSISLVEFKRAIKACTDFDVSESVLRTVFLLFDENGDGFMSPHEFMILFKNRRKRGLSKDDSTNLGNWKQYVNCLRRKITEN